MRNRLDIPMLYIVMNWASIMRRIQTGSSSPGSGPEANTNCTQTIIMDMTDEKCTKYTVWRILSICLTPQLHIKCYFDIRWQRELRDPKSRGIGLFFFLLLPELNMVLIEVLSTYSFLALMSENAEKIAPIPP